MSKAPKAAATVLEYPTAEGILIDHIDTHLLRSGGANALSLSGYSDTQIQKIGASVLLRRDVKEHEENFDFVNITGNAFNAITDDLK